MVLHFLAKSLSENIVVMYNFIRVFEIIKLFGLIFKYFFRSIFKVSRRRSSILAVMSTLLPISDSMDRKGLLELSYGTFVEIHDLNVITTPKDKTSASPSGHHFPETLAYYVTVKQKIQFYEVKFEIQKYNFTRLNLKTNTCFR